MPKTQYNTCVRYGKAYSRALRAHFLTQTALLSFVLQLVFDSPEISPMRRKLLDMCRKVYRGSARVLREADVILLAIQERGRTARLWFQFIRQVELIRLFLRAERVGDWDLHLHAVREMLPYFHAAGHLNKSAQLYLQLMTSSASRLPPAERDALFGGGFCVRKQDKLWSGNFSDQTIGMDYMRLPKGYRGNNHAGQRYKEYYCSLGEKYAIYRTVEVIRALENFCGISVISSYQHTDIRDARINLNADHKEKFKNWLAQHNPFDKPADQLVCLSSGLVADITVSCDKAFMISASMAKYVGRAFSDITLHRKEKAVPLSAMNRSISVQGAAVQVNPTQLFHRIIIAQKDVSDLEQHFA
ncbi:LOW QUALITY PROTEIN: E3 ubiquitin-protein ligase RNF31 [Frankliniella fusca]|uniref:E3 ubiquitin-protein ligase RNF31 n=1 Tax=Frankliniella fusca TaxID=407009 RepID=A0AAE1HE42_9NEOP|nr:LOW QUALITY PROTEIN: E3 ubiquitin-protein ligase RNF31 [Frankliniella fusca]